MFSLVSFIFILFSDRPTCSLELFSKFRDASIKPMPTSVYQDEGKDCERKRQRSKK